MILLGHSFPRHISPYNVTRLHNSSVLQLVVGRPEAGLEMLLGGSD